jgi:ABC-type multidrug transport system ATPase subunit
MDPCARRSVWEVLRRKRLGRTILLSTHFMDEAELLSDRIAIMRSGNLLCSGSPLFLKTRHALGYNFTVVMETASSSPSISKSTSSVESRANSILALISRYAPGAGINRIGGKEVTIRIPPGYEDVFPTCFDELEKERESMQMGALGIQNASLEEVFISLAQNHDQVMDTLKENPESSQLSGNKHNSAAMIEQESLVDGGWEKEYMSPMQQILLLYAKRVSIQKRDPGGLFALLVVPVIVIALTLSVLNTQVSVPGHAIDLSLNLYQSSNTGGAALTDVLVGGGNASGLNPSGAIFSTSQLYKSFRNHVQEEYPHVKLQRVEQDLSSADVSNHLYQSINHHDHNMRYGAFVFNDTVRMEVSVNWPELFDKLENIVATLDDDQLPWSARLPLGKLSSFADFGALTKLNKKHGSSQERKKPHSPASSGTKTSMDSIKKMNSILDPSKKTNSVAATNSGVNQSNAAEKSSLESKKKIVSTVDPDVTTDTSQKANSAAEARNSTTSIVDHNNEANLVVGPSNNATDKSSLDSIKMMNSTADTKMTMNPSKKTSTIEETDSLVNQNNSAVSAVDHTKANYSVVGPSNATDSVLDAGPVVSLLASTTPPKDLGLFEGKGKKSNLDPGLLSNGILNDKNAKSNHAYQAYPGFGLEGTTGVNSAMMSTLLGSQSGSLMDPNQLINENTMVKLTFYPSESILNIEPELDLHPFLALIFAGQSFSRNMTLEELRYKAPFKNESYLRYLPANVSILHNTSSPHAVAAFNQAFSEFLFKECTGKSNARLISENHPLPLSTQQATGIKAWLNIVAGWFVLIPLGYIPGGFIVFLVKEKSSKSKHLQLVSGVDLTSYWIAGYLYDITLYLVLTILVMAVFLLYGKDAAEVFVGNNTAFLCTFTLTFGYGVAVLPYSYLMARRFENHSAAQIAVAALNFATGFIPYFMTFIGPKFKVIAEPLQPIFRCWPPFLVGEGLALMTKAFWTQRFLGSDVSPLDWEFAGRPIFLLYALAIVYFAILLGLEYSQDGGAGGMLGRCLRAVCDSWERLLLRIHGVRTINGTLMLDDGLVDDKSGLDDDVLAEERRVNENIAVFKRTAPIMYHNLWKVYPPSVGLLGSMLARIRQFLSRICCWCCGNAVKPEQQRRAHFPKRAVRGVSTVVEEGETYALLGSNGAGKTSTLGVLTGDVSATCGQVYVAGHDATGNEQRNGVTMARRHLGFCPQVDPLLDLMSARETLQMYGRLRGIPANRIDGQVTSLLGRLSLTPHADKPAQNLSGGNKRKLSLGIALIGDPKILLIDESSSGMDPLSKRRMWNLIADVSKNKTVIATTHSMEEAEALCTRAGIMAKGRLLCQGSVQHLKTKYLDGYTIDVFCTSGRADEEIDVVVNEILETALPGCKLSERHGRFLRFNVPSLSSLGLGTTFSHMQALKTSATFCVENYSISQCSLEQVFVKLVEQVTTLGTEKKDTSAAVPDDDDDIDSEMDEDEEAPFLI